MCPLKSVYLKIICQAKFRENEFIYISIISFVAYASNLTDDNNLSHSLNLTQIVQYYCQIYLDGSRCAEHIEFVGRHSDAAATHVEGIFGKTLISV